MGKKEKLKEQDNINLDEKHKDEKLENDKLEDVNQDITIEETKIEETEPDFEKKYHELSKEYQDKMQRAMAEFDNFRKRSTLEKLSMYENGVKDTIEKMLPVLDNFERAILSINDKESTIYKGVEMIFNQMKESFDSMGVFEVAKIGDVFDPNIHNAVIHIDDETVGENVIVEVMQKGYKYKDKIIRPSMVKVAN